MIKRRYSGGIAIASLILAISLTACSPASPPATEETASPPAASVSDQATVLATTPYYIVKNYKGAEVRPEGDSYTVIRATEDTQGLTILPTNAEHVVMLDFGVTGDVESVRAYRLGEWRDLATQGRQSVRIGRGGATQLMITPTSGGNAVVSISNAQSCASLPADRCPILEVQ